MTLTAVLMLIVIILALIACAAVIASVMRGE